MANRITTRRVTLLIMALGSISVMPGPRPVCDGVNVAGRAGQYVQSAFVSDRRGCVPYTVYLPPGWSADSEKAYPLIVFLHGQWGDETTFPAHVPVTDLNEWIAGGEVGPFVLIAPRGSDDRRRIQWFRDGNVEMLVDDGPTELRAHARERFRAGLTPSTISVHGQSRGATGALFFALRYPDRFASAVANSYVSDYALAFLEGWALHSRTAVVESGIAIRMTIGQVDLESRDRVGSPRLHAHLDSLGIAHEYALLPGVPHTFAEVWKHQHADGEQAGLRDLRFHERAWDVSR